jgi:small conductance mechanosensitive channel
MSALNTPLADPATSLLKLAATAPTCTRDTGSVCQTVWSVTHNTWLAASSEWLLVRPFQIILILVVALLIRWLVHRMIKRFTRTRDSRTAPALLRPLAEKMPNALIDTSGTSGTLTERRRQRAGTIGSLLRNISSIVIFSIAVMLVLGVLKIDLAPFLASAGIAGVAIGFGAQSLVKDVISGMFMLLEDQYGVGDNINVGEVSGTVEAVGLRITTIRDGVGVIWYVRNGEILRVGNHSQSWAVVQVDVPITYGAPVEETTRALDRMVGRMAEDDDWAPAFIDPPELLGVQQITVDGAVLRVQAKTSSEDQWRVGRELRRRVTVALEEAGVASRLGGSHLATRTVGAVADAEADNQE